MIVFVTSGVIVVTLLQGLALPGLVRWARLPADVGVRQERFLAETTATEEALTALPQLAAELGTAPDVVERLRLEYENHLAVLHAADTELDDPAVRNDRDYTALRLAAIARKCATLVRLRDERRIDDTVLRQVQTALDNEEVRLARRDTLD